jgi:hypothetical protein
MADFEQTFLNKNSKRKLTTKWDTIVYLNKLIQPVLTNNPRGCTSYTSAGETIAGVRESGV